MVGSACLTDAAVLRCSIRYSLAIRDWLEWLSMETPTLVEAPARHHVAPGELFFSTTDAKGRILRSNSVFVRLSRYSRDQLVGQPHNIIRHDAMPGGAFRLMWEVLAAGEPFCAYVDNLAADGSTYGVFATITPLGDGYLSVRGRPGVDGLREAAFSLYREVRPHELQLRAEGHSAHAAAERGLGMLADLLGRLGLTYEQFMWTALPDEVDVLLQSSISRIERDDADGVLAATLRHAARTRTDLLTWTSQMAELQTMSHQLSHTAGLLMEAIEEHRQTADRISDAPASGFNSAVVYLRVWSDISGLLEPIFTQLAETLTRLHRHCALTRFRIALALLHIEALTQFINEAVDDGYYSEDHRASVALLSQALDEGLQIARGESVATADLVQRATIDVSFVADLISMPQTMITTWLQQATPEKDGAELYATVVAQREHTEYAWQHLNDLIAQAQHVSNPLDIERARAEIAVIQRLTAGG